MSKQDKYSKLSNDELFQLLSSQDKWIINSSMASCGIEGYYLDEKGIRKLILECLMKPQ